MSAHKLVVAPDYPRCPACGVLCADAETYGVHIRFCEKMKEQHKKRQY